MGLLAPTPPPYDPIAWSKLPLHERGRMVCEAWALQGYGTPLGVFLAYALKLALYVAGWVVACRFSPGLGDLSSIGTWWLAPVAFQKAIVWSLLFEVLGLGCGSGPLTGRYFPPVGGFLYFLRPGTTKLPLFPGLPLVGQRTRSIVDVLAYLGLVVAAVRLLLAPAPDVERFVPVLALLGFLAVTDKTVFLAARGEHYGVVLVCFAFAGGTDAWIAGAKAVALALWFWAGVSKLNHHFPSVISVMTSNGPFTRFLWLRRRMYRRYPDDLRPSTLAIVMSHMGTAMEIGVPVAFMLTPLGTPPLVAILLMLALHGYITSNVPMGVPIEWNLVVAYSGFALFWAHPAVSLAAIGSPPLAVFLVVMLVVVPLLGNLLPARVSFLMAMRYYAGNWPFSIWLFRGESYRKLGALTTSSAWVMDQLDRFYDRPTGVGLVGKVMGFRLMHLHGRALPLLVPKAIARLEDHEWVDGELVAGLALGWNFGDGHLHHEQLLESLQAQCGWEEGELRCIFVEPQPLFGHSLAYRIVDAKTGRLEEGHLRVDELRTRQPWQAAVTPLAPVKDEALTSPDVE
jgi:hypothetical protein